MNGKDVQMLANNKLIIFEAGQHVKRNQEYCVSEFHGLEEVVWLVYTVDASVAPMLRAVNLDKISNLTEKQVRNIEYIERNGGWREDRFCLVDYEFSSFKLDLKSLSSEELFSISEMIDNEWLRRSKNVG